MRAISKWFKTAMNSLLGYVVRISELDINAESLVSKVKTVIDDRPDLFGLDLTGKVIILKSDTIIC